MKKQLLRIFSCAVLVLAVLCCFAACGGNDSTTEPPNGSLNPATDMKMRDKEYTYNGSSQSIEVMNLPDDATVTYEGNGQTEVGTYPIKATVVTKEGYTYEFTATLTITKATPQLKVIQNGAAKPGEKPALSTGSNVEGDFTLDRAVEAGVHTYSYTFTPADTKNYNGTTGKVTIASAAETVVISDKASLLSFMQEGQSKDFANTVVLLTANIDLNDAKNMNWYADADAKSQWTPIRDFAGIFFGNGFKINGLYLDIRQTEALAANTGFGMFQNLKGATVHSLALTNAYVLANYSAQDANTTDRIFTGGLLYGTATAHSYITDCVIFGTLSVSSANATSTGNTSLDCGLIGGWGTATLKNCAAVGALYTSGKSGCGALVSGLSGGGAEHCYTLVKGNPQALHKWSVASATFANCYCNAADSDPATLVGNDAKTVMQDLDYTAFTCVNGSLPLPALIKERQNKLDFNVMTSNTLKLASVFQSHMILQRDREITVYGTGNGQGSITFDGETKNINSETGEWEVKFAPRSASTTPKTMTVKLGSKTTELTDILLGDVYITAGQSNMELTLQSTVQKQSAAKASEILRFRNHNGDWQAFTATNTQSLSAISVLFAQEIEAATQKKIPVGVISCAVGATRIEDWTSAEYADREPYLTYLKNPHSDHKLYHPEYRKDHTCYKTYIQPITKLSVAGVLWYQGESNRGIGEALYYYELFKNMVNCWRDAFGRDDLPFYTVQIMLYTGNSGKDQNGKAVDEYNIRIAQGDAARTIPYVTVCTMLSEADTKCADGHWDIHPDNKAPVAKALANAALSTYYQPKGDYDQTPEYSGPLYDQVAVNGNTARITFTHTAEGLMLTSGTTVTEIEVRKANGNWVKCTDAKLEGNTLVVTADDEITGVRMGYENKPSLNLYNTIGGQRGYCASPFQWIAD